MHTYDLENNGFLASAGQGQFGYSLAANTLDKLDRIESALEDTLTEALGAALDLPRQMAYQQAAQAVSELHQNAGLEQGQDALNTLAQEVRSQDRPAPVPSPAPAMGNRKKNRPSP